MKEPVKEEPMVILSADQTDRMVKVMDYIFKHSSDYRISVYQIRNKFHLTQDEYNMIFDLCMPFLRHDSIVSYWRIRYKFVINNLKRLLASDVKLKDYKEALESIIERSKTSDMNNVANMDYSDDAEEIA